MLATLLVSIPASDQIVLLNVSILPTLQPSHNVTNISDRTIPDNVNVILKCERNLKNRGLPTAEWSEENAAALDLLELKGTGNNSERKRTCKDVRTPVDVLSNTNRGEPSCAMPLINAETPSCEKARKNNEAEKCPESIASAGEPRHNMPTASSTRPVLASLFSTIATSK